MEDLFLETLFTKGLMRRPFENLAATAQKAAAEALATDGPAAAVLKTAALGARAAADIARVRVAAGQWDPAPACRRGCAHCCALKVDITTAEAALLRAAIPHDDPRRERVKARAKELLGLSEEERMQSRVPCALLGEDGACSVYEARPLVCRAASSLDADACARAKDRPDAAGEIPVEPWSSASMRAAHVGLRRALATDGKPAPLEDIHQALAKLL